MTGFQSKGCFRGTPRAALIALAFAVALPAVSVTPVFAQTAELPERVRAMDANGNGKIERDEAQGPLAANFDSADTNKDGAIDGDEMAALFARFRGGGGGAAPATAAAPAATSGTAGTDAPSTELSERAKGLDQNGNGVIDKEEARGALAANFDRIDADNSGGIDGAELSKFFGGGSGGTAVQVDLVREGGISQTVPVIGRLVALQSGPVASRVSGPVSEIRVSVGDRVKRGDVMVVVSHDRLQSESDRLLALVEQRQAMVAIVAAEFEKTAQEMRRLENLRRGVAFSQKRFDDVTQELAVRKGQRDERQAQLAQATEQLNRANIDLRDADIRAPYDGVVTERHVDVGVWLSNSTPVVTLFNDREVEVEADVPSDRIVGLAVGDEVRLSLDDGTIHGAVLRAIVPVENPLTRTRAVRFTPKFGTTLKAPALNQSVTVAIAIGGSRRVLTVLKDAILRPDGQPTVFVVEGNTVQPRIVVLGESAGNRFIVLKGLKAGDRAVYRGNEQLQAGQRVRIVENGDGDTAARTN